MIFSLESECINTFYIDKKSKKDHILDFYPVFSDKPKKLKVIYFCSYLFEFTHDKSCPYVLFLQIRKKTTYTKLNQYE